MGKIGEIIEELEQIISEEEKATAKLTLDNGETVETEAEGSDEDIKKQYQVGQNVSVGRNGMNKQAKIKSVQVTRTVGESLEDKLGNDPVLVRRAKELGYDKMSKEELQKEYKKGYKNHRVMGQNVDLVDNQILHKLLKEDFKVHPRKFKIDEIEEETANYKRKRLASPKSCKVNSFRTKQVNAKGDKVILCKDKKSNKLKAQSVLTAKNEDRFFKKELTPLPKKETEFKIGDVVTLDNNQTGEIIQTQLMAMSDTPVYKIKTKDGKNVWRYQEEIKQAVSEMDMGDLGTDPIGKMGVVKAKGLARNKKFKRKNK